MSDDEPIKYPECPLPDTASALIRLALDDLAKVELDPRYQVYMGSWHEVVKAGDVTDDFTTVLKTDVCLLCFAGAVMAGTCGIPPGVDAYPTDFPPASKWKFSALDYLRTGRLVSALFCLDSIGFVIDAYPDAPMNQTDSNRKRMVAGIPESVYIPSYDESPDDFRLAMERLAVQLEGAGL